MRTLEAEQKETEKLVNNELVAKQNYFNVLPPGQKLTNKRIRRIVEPHLRAHKVKGRVYYTYCRGTNKEIYLGDADAILKAVKGGR